MKPLGAGPGVRRKTPFKYMKQKSGGRLHDRISAVDDRPRVARAPPRGERPPPWSAAAVFFLARHGRPSRRGKKRARRRHARTPTTLGDAAVSFFGQTPAGTRRPRGRGGRGCGRAAAARAGVCPLRSRRRPHPAPPPCPGAHPHRCTFSWCFPHPSPRLVPACPSACVDLCCPRVPSCRSFRHHTRPPVLFPLLSQRGCSSRGCGGNLPPRLPCAAALFVPRPCDPTLPVWGTAAFLPASRRSRGNSESTKGRASLEGGHRRAPSTPPHPPLPPLARFDRGRP